MLRILLDSLLSLEKIKENERVNALWRVSKRACKLRQPNMLGIYMYIYNVYMYRMYVSTKQADNPQLQREATQQDFSLRRRRLRCRRRK